MSSSGLARTALNRQQEKAAHLVAFGGKGVEEIADEVGVRRVSIWRWRELPAFRARVKEIEARLDAEVYASGYAKRRNRVTALAEMANLLGGQIKASRQPQPGLVAQWSRLLEQIAREMGQWTDRVDLSVEGRVEQVRTTEVLIRLNVGADEELARKAQAYLDGTPEPPEAVTEAVTEADWRPVERPALVPGGIDQRGPDDEDAPVDSLPERTRLKRINDERIRQAQEGREFERLQRNYR